MQHLTLEDLARLVDEAAEPHEAEHLRGCLVCRRELAELRSQTEALGALPDPEPTPAAWLALEARLRSDGLIRGAAPLPARGVRFHPVLRIAAALVLFLAGGVAGAALWRGGGAAPLASGPATLPASRAVASPSMAMPVVSPVESGAAEAAPAGVRLVGNGTGADNAAARPAGRRRAPLRVTRAEAQEAARELVRAQAAYLAALERYAAIADPASGNDAGTRMAALDRLVELTADGLERVPGDPVVNGYHLAAVSARDALRREMDKDARTTWF
ncbi:MAG TPA: hypothetical protein VFQ45_21940 [Longimicrobium sp.]|nr:hypothetical protein [Longimicrobium sp.]